MIAKYKNLVTGHIIAQTAPICPATVQLDLVVEAVRTIRPDLAAAKLEPQIHQVENQSPICVNPARAVWIEIELDASNVSTWKFQVFSTDEQNEVVRTTHTTGKIIFFSVNDLGFRLEFARLERLTGNPRCVELLQSTDAEDVIQGRNIYKTFAELTMGLNTVVSSNS